MANPSPLAAGKLANGMARSALRPTFAIDQRRLIARVSALRAYGLSFPTAAAVEYAYAFARTIEARAPRDTQAYVRAWTEAYNGARAQGLAEIGIGSVKAAAGLPGAGAVARVVGGGAIGVGGAVVRSVAADVPPSIEVPMLRASRKAAEIRKAFSDLITELSRKIGTIEHRQENWYLKKGRKPDRWYRRAETRKRRLARDAAKLAERLAVWEGSGQTYAVFDWQAWLREARGRRLISIRAKRYGGLGEIIGGGGPTAYARLVNREPHARIVEKRYGLVAGAIRELKGAGGKRVASRVRTDVVKVWTKAVKDAGGSGAGKTSKMQGVTL